jgi:histidinol-phosphate aminotransferase
MSILGLTTPMPTSPAHFDLISLIRPNILALKPYRCARDDFDEGILLDANENAIGHSIEVSSGEESEEEEGSTAAEGGRDDSAGGGSNRARSGLLRGE